MSGVRAEPRKSAESVGCAAKAQEHHRAFALEPVRRPAARFFSEEGEILSESLVRILTGLNRDLEGLLRATAAMRPYFGENPKDGQFPHLLTTEQSTRRPSAERGESADSYLSGSPTGFLGVPT